MIRANWPHAVVLGNDGYIRCHRRQAWYRRCIVVSRQPHWAVWIRRTFHATSP